MNLGIETERVEFKESTSELKEGCASIASMLNKHGEGTLYFGVKRNGDVSGQDVAESTLRKVSQAIGNYIEPPVYPTIEKLGDDGKDYIRVTFSGSDRPYQCDGRYRIRRSDEDVIMSAAEVARMVRESYDRAVPWDGRPSGRPVSDVDEGALRRFVEEGNSSGRIEAPYTSAQEVLAGLGLLAEDGTLTNAAAALFCRSRVGVRLKAGVLADHSRVEIIDLRQEDDPVFDLIGRAEFYVLSNIRKRIVIDGSPSRDEVPEIPRAALREAIVNAFCHQDFTDYGTAVQVDVFPDSVEITNPGTFPTGRTPERRRRRAHEPQPAHRADAVPLEVHRGVRLRPQAYPRHVRRGWRALRVRAGARHDDGEVPQERPVPGRPGRGARPLGFGMGPLS